MPLLKNKEEYRFERKLDRIAVLRIKQGWSPELVAAAKLAAKAQWLEDRSLDKLAAKILFNAFND